MLTGSPTHHQKLLIQRPFFWKEPAGPKSRSLCERRALAKHQISLNSELLVTFGWDGQAWDSRDASARWHSTWTAWWAPRFFIANFERLLNETKFRFLFWKVSVVSRLFFWIQVILSLYPSLSDWKVLRDPQPNSNKVSRLVSCLSFQPYYADKAVSYKL